MNKELDKNWSSIRDVLDEEIMQGIESFGFEVMTPVQATTIPLLLKMKDVAVEAVTGSGKTLAFLIPLLHILKRREDKWKKHDVGAIVLSPTRELALQTFNTLKQLLEHVSGLTQMLIVGGGNIEEDLRNLNQNGANILICTPGRLEDFLSRQPDLNLALSVKSVEFLVLDEADRLLDLGFKESIDTILTFLPKQRRTGLFSATQTKQVEALIRAGLRNPVVVSVKEKSMENTPLLLNNYYMITRNNGKLATLISFLEKTPLKKALLFLPTCACVSYWSQVLARLVNFPISSIHGKMKEKRWKILDKFRKLPRGILICTDIMARGIDIPEVDWVLQWDPPANASAFVHRVGRTARQGNEGSSLVFLLESEETYVHFIERNQKVKLERLPDYPIGDKVTVLGEKLRKFQSTDRDLMEKATRAFVSHIRAYSKHECSLILNVKELPLGAMASTYGLLQLPRMPELKNSPTSDFIPSKIDPNSIPYKNKEREVLRQSKLETYKATGVWPGKSKVYKKPTEAWSESKSRKEDRKAKKIKRKLKNTNVDKKRKRKGGFTEEDLNELASDIALLKKFKKKKITEEQFDKEIGLG